MSGRRSFLCLCLDITEKDLDRAVAEGFTHPELLKRYTACFMGPCQGKSCMDTILAALSERTGQDISEMRRPTLRPPAHPVPLRVLAAEDGDE
jgi:bacterioferritin-associated ferredoxin